MKRWWMLSAAALAGCIFVPRTEVVYDEACHIILAGLGAVAAASAVISGSIVVTGNVVYWLEKQGHCLGALG